MLSWYVYLLGLSMPTFANDRLLKIHDNPSKGWMLRWMFTERPPHGGARGKPIGVHPLRSMNVCA